MAPHSRPQEISRRRFVLKYVRWTLVITSAALFYPLLRFSGYTVKPKPRHITVHKVIPGGSTHTDHDFILFMLEEGPVAVSRRCTHLGCRVNYRQELGAIECPCHQSRFTTQGIRVAGPAKQDLATFPVKMLKDDNDVTTGYIVTI